VYARITKVDKYIFLTLKVQENEWKCVIIKLK
jgi:hypothetical protein